MLFDILDRGIPALGRPKLALPCFYLGANSSELALGHGTSQREDKQQNNKNRLLYLEEPDMFKHIHT